MIWLNKKHLEIDSSYTTARIYHQHEFANVFVEQSQHIHFGLKNKYGAEIDCITEFILILQFFNIKQIKTESTSQNESKTR